MTDEKDNLFAESRAVTSGFQFDEQVVRVFPDMIVRSVPGYELIIPMLGMLARRYAQPDSKIYDLGCSLGAASLAMAHAVNTSGNHIVAVDNSPAMVTRCRQMLARLELPLPVEVVLQDIQQTGIENASVVVLNFTLQFLDKDQRQALIDRIASGLRPGGVVLISEKIRFEDPGEDSDQAAWHHDFKRTQGYSELEIAQKRDALENVLVPETEETHFERLKQAGLQRPCRWFQCFSFASYIAFK
jgi:tRNA (cmo5U34)-methyltransferase